MLIQTFAIRLLTVLAYFLPFTFFMATCEGQDVVLVYNKKEAMEIRKGEIKGQIEMIDSLLASRDTSKEFVNSRHEYIAELLESNVKREFGESEKWHEKLMMPVPYYLSGIGVLFYPKTTGMGVVMWLSAILSLLTFLFWRFLKRWLITILFIGVNFIALVIYMIRSLTGDASLEHGFWLLFFLIVLQLWIEMREFKYSIIGRLFASMNRS